MERARRDLSEVYSRLFDHRPVVQAEIRYFVKEFEEKRGFREQRGLENVNSMIEELGSQSILNASEGLSRNIPTVLPRSTLLEQELRPKSAPAVQVQGRHKRCWNPKLKPNCWRNSAVEAAIQITNRIQQKEQAADQSNQLQASRESRKAEWEAFVKEQHRKAAEVDEEHTKAADWLTQQYAAMEKDLAKFTTF